MSRCTESDDRRLWQGVTATSVRLTLPGNLREREGGPAPLTVASALRGFREERCPSLADSVRGPASHQICVPKFGTVCDASWGCPPSVRELLPTDPNVAQGVWSAL